MAHGIEFTRENVKENQGLSLVDGIKITINYAMSTSIRLKDLDEKHGFWNSLSGKLPKKAQRI